MHRVVSLIFCIFPLTSQAAPKEPVALESGISPDGRFEVVLESDRDTPSYANYEMKGDTTAFPGFLIIERKTGKSLIRIEYPADPETDEQPLRKHTEVKWSPTSLAVAINTHERFYSHLSLAAYDSKHSKFKEIQLPDYKTLTGFPQPDSDQLRPRGFESVLSWNAKGNFVYELGLSPEASYNGPDPLHHIVELSISASGCKVVKRIPIKDSDG